jgi:DNA-binding NtrC family response regulator
MVDRLRCPLCGGSLKLLAGETPTPPLHDLIESLQEVTRRHVLLALRLHHGRREETAKALGVSRTTLRRWLDMWSTSNPGPGQDEP